MKSSNELQGMTALITGGSKNIGRAIALELAHGGASVALLTRTDRGAGESTAEAARALGVEAQCFIADVTNEKSVRETVGKVAERFGRIDVLVNNAAVRREAALEDMSLADWHEILAVTLDGAFLCTRECLPWLNAAAAGAVINIGGLTAYTGAANRAHVVTAKAGLDGLTRALAVELAAKTITVNSVGPGLIATQRDGPTPHHHASNETLVRRRGLPEEIAAAVRFLAGPKARYITGQTLHVNGGAYLG
jgi:3-oxoacyl-[acyl-carrier protein] reductase